MISLIRSTLLFSGLLAALTCGPATKVVAGPPTKSSAGAVDSYRLYMLLRKHPHLVRKHPTLAREVEFEFAKAALPVKIDPVAVRRPANGDAAVAGTGTPRTPAFKDATLADFKTAE